MYLHKTPFWVRKIFPDYTWKKDNYDKNLYLTFDDGPIPGVTDFVLKQLSVYNAKATFFCVGDNIIKYPEVFKKIIDGGHRIGNHTFNHLNGWKITAAHYYDNIIKCQDALSKYTNAQQLNLFRPPYGKIRASQAKDINEDFEIIMWDVLSGDFDSSLKPDKCLSKTIRAAESGSVIVFHDSLKAEANIRFVLPRFLKHFSEDGYNFLKL